MTEAEAFELLAETFVPAWESATDGLPLVLENEAMSTAPSFGMLTMKHTVSQPITIGAVRRYERRGWVFVKLWLPADRGRKGFSELADAVRDILEGEQIGAAPDEPITLDAGLTQEIGPDGTYYIGVVSFPFRYYATR